jgi:hypothetical protein
MPPRPAPAGTPLAQAKAECRAAHKAATAADPIMRAVYDRWLAETLLVVRGAPSEAAAEMFRRMRIGFQIAADRTTWPLR